MVKPKKIKLDEGMPMIIPVGGKIAFARKIYNENTGTIEEINIEVSGDTVIKCKKEFESIMKNYDTFNHGVVEKKLGMRG